LNPLHYSVWDILQELVYEGRHKPYANLKDLQNVITDTWHDVDNMAFLNSQSQKSHIAVKKSV